MIEDYKYRIYEKSDCPKIFKLLGEHWGADVARRTEELWDWRIERNPCNPPEGARIHIATCQDQVIAVMGTIPKLFKFKDRTRTFLWVVDYLADPHYKTVGWRIFMRLYKEPYLLIGTPNYTSYTIGLAAKWVEICKFYNFFHLIRPERVLATKRKLASLAPLVGAAWALVRLGYAGLRPRPQDPELEIQEVTHFGNEFDELWASVSDTYEVIAHRDSQFLTWKYLQLPGKTFRIFLARRGGRPVGYIITRVEQEEGYRRGEIVDFLTASEDTRTLSLLFAKGLEVLRAEGADVVNCFLIPYSPAHAALLRKYGFWFRKKRYPIIGYETKTCGIPKAEFTRAKWFLTGGDSDLTMG